MRTLALMLCASLPLLAPADAARGGDAGPVAEIVTFRLVPGTDEAAFLAAARATGAPVSAQPGFVSRHLSRDDTGLWTDHVLWSDMGAALAAAQAVMEDPAFGPFVALIDPEGMAMRHAHLRWSMGD